MSATPPDASGALLDQDTPDTIRLSVAEATALGERALRGVGLPDDDVRIIVDQLIDNALCGYPFASLPRILAIAQDAKTQQARQPVRIVHETPVSALLDGGNNVGYVAVYRATQVAIDKARAQQFAVVGVYNSYYSGRNAYYMEMIVKAGLVGMHLASAQPHVVPPGGTRPALGTNPLCFGFPSAHGPVIFDIGTSALMWGEVLLHAHLDKPLPAGTGVDKDGNVIASRIEALRVMYDKLYLVDHHHEIDFGAYLEELCRSLLQFQLAERKSVRLDLRCAPQLQVNLDRSVPLGLLTSEFVVNSLKHAFADGRGGTLTVQLDAVDEQRARLLLADDGSGMPATSAAGKGSGLRLIEQLAAQAGATLTWDRAAGTRAELVFPV